MATSPPTFDVFLSHNSKDKAAIRQFFREGETTSLISR